MDSNALITLEEAVTRYLLKYKKQSEDYITYLEHASNAVREFHMYDAKEYRTEKVSVDSLGIIEMPVDMIGFKDVGVYRNGEFWSFTERPLMVNTTTTTGDTEGHDDDFGEGVALLDNVVEGYGGKGAVNSYYYMIDWDARRIFCDGITSDTVVLKYVSTGIKATETTYIPDIFTEVLDNYLLWKETFWLTEIVRERPMRKQEYVNARLQLRGYLNRLTLSQWQDLLWGSTTMTPKR